MGRSDRVRNEGEEHSGGVMFLRQREKLTARGGGRRNEDGERSKGERASEKSGGALSWSYYSQEFVYHQASADYPPALQIKLTASTTGIHYTRRADSSLMQVW